jgi:NO-binding membrane sensor protein with MHYT domain
LPECGVVLGVGVALALRSRIDSTNRSARPSALAWTAFGLGVASVITVASALFLPLVLPGPEGKAFNSAQISLVLSIAGVTDAVWAIARRDRRWVSWTALVVGALPTLFWSLFALGHLFDPRA